MANSSKTHMPFALLAAEIPATGKQRGTRNAFVWFFGIAACARALGAAQSDPEPPRQSSAASVAVLISSLPLNRPRVSQATSLFERLPGQQTGIDLVHEFPKNVPFEYLQDQSSGAGVCLGDYDGDGNADVFLTNYNRNNRLYRNLGDWRFEDVTARAGVSGDGRWCAGASFVDLDNDGDLDLYVCVFNAPNLLYMNQGDGTFKEQAKAFGLDYAGASVMMAFGDYDLDGRLDAYLVTHRLNVGADHRLPRNSREAFARSIVRTSSGTQLRVSPAYSEWFEILDKGNGRTEVIIAGQKDYLYHDAGKGGLTIVNGEDAGIRGNDIGLAATWWDYNGDGFPDLYVCNDYRGPDHLYHNNGDGTFADVARSALPHVPWASMGADVADINNDGRMDLIATDMAGNRHLR